MNKTWKNILFVFLFSLFLSMVLFTNPLYRSHDTTFHIANILAIEELFEEGNFFSLIIPRVGFNLGYGTRIFYPPLAHTLTAMVSLLFTPATALKIIHFLTIFLSGVSMYFLAKRFSNSRYLALFSSLFYICMPYFLSDIYIRCALAESLVFIFVPLIVRGLIELLDGKNDKFYPLFIVGYVGGMLSHLMVMVYGTILFAIFLVIYRKEFFKKEKLIPFIKACFIVLLCTSFFWLPLAIHKVFASYAVFQDGYMARDISYYALKIFDFNPLQTLDNSEIHHYFPLVVTILLVFTYFYRSKISFPKYTKGLLIIGIVSFILCTVLFPWDYLPYSFQTIQFPWRIETFLVIIVSLFAPLCLSTIKKREFINTLIIIGLFCGSYFCFHPAWDIVIDFSNISWIDGMGWGYEYLPISAIDNFSYFENRNSEEIIVLEGGSTHISVLEKDSANFIFLVSDLKSPIIVELPRIFYYGYQLINDKGSVFSLYESEKGFIQSEITEEGIYHLKYVGFPISRTISFVSIFGFSFYYIYYYYFSKSKTEKKSKNKY